MQISQTTANGLKQEYQVIVPATEFEAELNKQLQLLGQKVKLSGFRPGKVPLTILKKQYGDKATGEVLDRFVRNAVSDLNKEQSVKQAIPPRATLVSFEDGKDVELKLEIEALPKVDIKDFKTITLEKLVVDVSDENVQERLEKLFQNHKTYQPLSEDRPSQKKDLLHLDIDIKVNGNSIQDLGNHVHVELDDEIDLIFPLMKEKLTGIKAGSEVEFEDYFPTSFGNIDVAGKKAHVKIQVSRIEEPKVFKLDDEFSKEFSCTFLEELRQKINAALKEEFSDLARLRLKRHLLDELSESYDFELPPTLVEKEFTAIWDRLQSELAQARSDGTLSPEDDRPEEELRQEYQKISERRVRLGLLISEIARTNNIRVKDDELHRAVYREALRYPGHYKQVMDFYEKNAEALDQLAAPILEDKVVDFILTGASLKERRVDHKGLVEAVRGIVPGYEEDENEEAAPAKKASAKSKKGKS